MTPPLSPTLFPPLLLATDGSPSARLAQRLLYPIAQLLQSQSPVSVEDAETPGEEITLLMAVTVQPRSSNRGDRLNRQPRQPPPPTATTDLTTTDVTTVTTSTTLTTHQAPLSLEQLTALVQTEVPAGLSLSFQVRQGRPATEILNYARAIQAGLIAVGHRGTGGMRELLLGSVSTVIARYAFCSVLVARGSQQTEPPATPSLNHVLLLIDGSLASRQAIATVLQLVPIGIERVTLLCVQSPIGVNKNLFGAFGSPTLSWQLNQSLQTAQKEQGEQLLKRAKAALAGTNLDIQTRMQTGDPAPLICQVAQEQGANLIILGSDPTRRSLLSPLQVLRPGKRQPEDGPTKSRQALRNTRLSVTEDYVIHYAPCPVLLCRTPRAAQTQGEVG
ncbi:universal stress protein [Pantanalinema rosaneae CENA516]|uniref:universal stress protein n=1 Tax=Pantanalinema rosaneae TaxID=1620701 RepID=UPI003D6F70E8